MVEAISGQNCGSSKVCTSAPAESEAAQLRFNPSSVRSLPKTSSREPGVSTASASREARAFGLDLVALRALRLKLP